MMSSTALSKRQIHASLIEQGSSFRQFAIAHGYEPRTVTQVVERWAGKSDLPSGRMSFCILRDLSRVIGKEVLPGILGSEYATFSTPGAQPQRGDGRK